MQVKELKAILSVLNDDTEVYLEFQETRFKTGRSTCLKSVEVEEGFIGVTLKGVFGKTEGGDPK